LLDVRQFCNHPEGSPTKMPHNSKCFTIIVMLGWLLGVFIHCPHLQAADVSLAWDENTEPDLDGYAVYHGTASRQYSHRTDVGPVNRHTIGGLSEGDVYYFAVTAYDTSGNESAYSTELVYAVPTLDTDQDGLSDSQEQFYGTDPLDPDTDQDGMDDGWEVWYGTDPLLSDAQEDLDQDGIVNLDEYYAWVQDGNLPPDPPDLIEPSNHATAVTPTPTLIVDGFHDPNPGDRHAETLWQIASDRDFSDPIFELRTDRHLRVLMLPALLMEKNRLYYWRVKFIDHRGEDSLWSDAWSFVTTVHPIDDDGNGVPDDQEIAAVTDLDQNGVADHLQNDIKCVETPSGTVQIAIKCADADGFLDELTAFESDAGGAPVAPPVNLPMGMVGFRINLTHIGGIVEVTLYFSQTLADDLTWYKYTPLNGWEDYGNYVTFNADRRSVTMALQDGGFGDADGIANGIIVDPSGPAATTTETASTAPSGSSGGGCFIGSTNAGRPGCGSAAGAVNRMRNMVKALVERLKPISEGKR
jgi:hypothetical protein